MAAKKTKAKATAKKVKKSRAPATTEATEPEVLNPIAIMRKEMESLFDRYFGDWPSLRMPDIHWPEIEPFRSLDLRERLGKWSKGVRVDIAESDDGYTVTAEIPGMDEKDVEVSLVEKMLTISGQKEEERKESKKDYHLQERHFGSFRRSFRVPDDVDAGKISANFAKGMLVIDMPKTRRAKSKKRVISVKGE
jgi:HSP20 family protein